MKDQEHLDESAFTTEQAILLTGVTRRKLDYWIDTGLLSPDIEAAKGRGRVRLFSFRNLVELRVAVWLRDKVSLQLIRQIVQSLRTQGEDRPLSQVTFGVLETHMARQPRGTYDVVLQREDGGWETKQGQLIMEIRIPISQFQDEIQVKLAKGRKREGSVGRIEKRRGVLGSTPVIAGTRVPTSAVWSLARAGYSVEAIIESYPGLQKQDVRAALQAEEAVRARKRDTA